MNIEHAMAAMAKGYTCGNGISERFTCRFFMHHAVLVEEKQATTIRAAMRQGVRHRADMAKVFRVACCYTCDTAHNIMKNKRAASAVNAVALSG
jgi:hypothetical protein